MTDRNSFMQEGGIKSFAPAQTENAPALSGAGKEAIKTAFPTELVPAKEEMGFNREFAKFAYTVVNGKEPSELDLQKMKINADNSTKLSHPAWTFTKDNDAKAMANQIINSKNVRTN